MLQRYVLVLLVCDDQAESRALCRIRLSCENCGQLACSSSSLSGNRSALNSLQVDGKGSMPIQRSKQKAGEALNDKAPDYTLSSHLDSRCFGLCQGLFSSPSEE